MSTITLKGKEVHTATSLPALGSIAADFRGAKTDLSNVSLKDFAGKTILLNIFPSIDTGICSASARRFNKEVETLTNNTVILCKNDRRSDGRIFIKSCDRYRRRW